MAIRQSDIEANALAEAARLATEFKTHKQHCSRCTNATRGKIAANACEEGWLYILEIRKQNRRVDAVREEKRKRLAEQPRLI